MGDILVEFFDQLWNLVSGLGDLLGNIVTEVHGFTSWFLKCLECIQFIAILMVVYQILRLLDTTIIPFIKKAYEIIVLLVRWCGCVICCGDHGSDEEFDLQTH
jgi:hypothetical protein